VLKKYLQTPEGYGYHGVRREFEQECGILRIDSKHYFDVDAQVVEISKLQPASMDPRLCEDDYEFLSRSDALILNIDYPEY
jgi:hypothetical protein